MEEIRAYIASFDRITSHILGIYEKQAERLVGIRVVYVDPKTREYLVNILVGESDARGKGARHETRFAMHNFMFETLGMEAARCSVLAQNTEMIATLERNGWMKEHTDYKPKANAEGLVQILHFRLSRDTWRTTQAARAIRDQTG